eukprot:IDg2121t1
MMSSSLATCAPFVAFRRLHIVSPGSVYAVLISVWLVAGSLLRLCFARSRMCRQSISELAVAPVVLALVRVWHSAAVLGATASLCSVCLCLARCRACRRLLSVVTVASVVLALVLVAGASCAAGVAPSCTGCVARYGSGRCACIAVSGGLLSSVCAFLPRSPGILVLCGSVREASRFSSVVRVPLIIAALSLFVHRCPSWGSTLWGRRATGGMVAVWVGVVVAVFPVSWLPWVPLVLRLSVNMAFLSTLGSHMGRLLSLRAVPTFYCYAELLHALRLLFRKHAHPFERS